MAAVNRSSSVVLGGESRDQYLARNLDYYTYYQTLNTDTPTDAKVWLINMRRDTYNLDRPYFSDYLFEDWTLRQMVWDSRNVQELRAKTAAIGVIACWQAAEAIKILSGNVGTVSQDLMVIDTWNTACRMVSLTSLKSRARNCPACHERQFPFLDGALRTETVVLCGKNAVQIRTAAEVGSGDFAALTERLRHSGKVTNNGFFLRLTLEHHVLTVFRDGRAVVEGTTDPLEAKNLLSKTLGG